MLDHERELSGLLAATARGPTRNALFAVWLFVRLCAGLMPPEPLGERAHRRRLQAFAKRISTLSLAAPVRRALGAGAEGLQAATLPEAAATLERLAATLHDTLGDRAARAVAAAAETIRSEGTNRDDGS